MRIFDCDFSHLEGTNCYCSSESASLIRDGLSEVPTAAIHYLGTGDYHYLSLFMAEKIEEDFALLLFDQHPDDQASAFDEDMLSCGSWVARARELPHCKAQIWIDGKGLCSHGSLPLPEGLPLYFSIDLDILSPQFARTDWDQGELSLGQLLAIMAELGKGRKLIGADICGGITEAKGGSVDDMKLNADTIEAVTAVLQEIL